MVFTICQAMFGSGSKIGIPQLTICVRHMTTLSPEQAVVGIFYIKRGGGFHSAWENLRVTNREKNDPTNYGSDLGFRCVHPITDEFP